MRFLGTSVSARLRLMLGLKDLESFFQEKWFYEIKSFVTNSIYLVKIKPLPKPLCKSNLPISSQMKAHKWKAMKSNILSQESMFFLLFSITTSQNLSYVLLFKDEDSSFFFCQHWTSPFIITHKTLILNHHSSHGKLDVPHNGEKLRPNELGHICTSWVSCFISTHSPCQLENEGLNLNWWFILAQLSHQLCSHILLVFSLWPMLTKLCHPLIRMGGWCLPQMCTAVCNPQNKCSQLRSVSSLCCLTTEG